ncbi:heterokaryon incompatibility protein-domain-containing protein [Stachybotrys elegans]|uniref:Heterokaryon incompatibility protein-domain-containing protein n=1 Tax=Stachybotrys elegans TaxID=80388 RepID=A0A8K0SR11_9HYPO|nr:heterokaryon incompatibility protein-domain-containing protein [Stachybotrys elegans]
MPPCEICHDLDKSLRTHPLIKVPLRALYGSAEECYTCGLLRKICLNFFPETEEAQDLLKLDIFPSGKALLLSINAIHVGDDEDDPLGEVEGKYGRRWLKLWSLEETCSWEALKAGPRILLQHELLVAQAKSWISRCEEDHVECRNESPNQLPKRLVHVSYDSETDSYKTRLCEPSALNGTNEQADQKYASLSHCWGAHRILETRSFNYQEHLLSIPWISLSQTFRDAVKFTYHLGLEYIWIDSLCIIQDQRGDWAEEAAKMAEYYANAHVTLAATSAADGSMGFFPQSVNEKQLMLLEANDSRGRAVTLHVMEDVPHPWEADYEEDAYEYPLMTRGWVYQEHMLSRRFLHFGGRELMWECRSGTSCQCGMAESFLMHKYTTNSALSVMKRGGVGGLSRQQRQTLWYENVTSLMDLQFTYATDRLPAMAGIASQLGQAARGRYLAGLWEDTLVQDLCWRATADQAQRPEELQVAPSWSWASVKGSVLWMSDAADSVEAARVVRIHCQPNPPSYLGLLEEGKITLRGPFVLVKVKITQTKGEEGKGYDFAFMDPDGASVPAKGDWVLHADDTVGDLDAEDIAIVKMVSWSRASDARRRRAVKSSAVFLVLLPLEDASRDGYRRIGLLHALERVDSGEGNLLRWFDGVAVEREFDLF